MLGKRGMWITHSNGLIYSKYTDKWEHGFALVSEFYHERKYKLTLEKQIDFALRMFLISCNVTKRKSYSKFSEVLILRNHGGSTHEKYFSMSPETFRFLQLSTIKVSLLSLFWVMQKYLRKERLNDLNDWTGFKLCSSKLRQFKYWRFFVLSDTVVF